MKKIILIMMLALGLLAFSGCSKDEEAQEPAGETENEAAQQESAAGEAEIMGSFDKLLSGEYEEKDIIAFADENIDMLSPENTSNVILKLEEAQRTMQEKRMSELFEGDIQQKFMTQLQKSVIYSAGDVNDEELKEIVQEMTDNGYFLMMMEGDFYPVINYEAYKKYSKNATDDIKAYVDIVADEYSEFASMDAHLAVSRDELLERIFRSEDFLEKYSDSQKFDEIKELYSQYAGFYLYGMSFEPPEDKLSKDAMESYEKAVKTQKDSNFIKHFKGYYETVKSEGYKRTEKVEKERQDTLGGIMEKYN
ncbi:hypothetical protein SAMN02745945_02019 [Peptoclostridium litorale DSM 5388]|uniref:Lipoprotein n=1 Tax=Peptoclostridium litorale DSM 5388 TaxID=1121324 RepID=A0A069RGX7_PEPLI|nr:hypothetical protein [Peptoclostridium litorale]KDR96289.1 hypothetical protein CLIT_4c01260 [Peptoclostridium litorale DSM 5388]SIO15294.1 hypothetical protein SAMN02745945_02019 [Peptoclostridium litorale DSM 5388]